MITRFLRKIVNLFPTSLKVSILRYWRSRIIWLNRLRLVFSGSKSTRNYLKYDTVYWVDPKKIAFVLESEGYQELPNPGNQNNLTCYSYRDKGRVISGDWDILDKKFSDFDFYRSYEERVLKGTSWEQLPFYKRVLGQIEKGIKKWGCINKRELDERCASLDKIFSDIKQNGYKTREQQRKERGRDRLFDSDNDDEISINIGRYGDLIFNDGRHRLAFAKILGIEKVPVTISVRHSAWEELKKEIEIYAHKHRDKVYNPLTHIDLQGIPSHHGHTRFETIKNNMDSGNKTLLDIGSHWGYFCHRFEEIGFRCTAVENDPENIYFLEKLRRAENKNFEIIKQGIFDIGNKGPIKYDIALVLDVFHHFLKEDSSFQEFKSLLHTLEVNEMYFEPPVYTERQMAGAYVNFTNEEFVDFILKNSCLKNHKLIGEFEQGRVIYKLWR